MEKQCESCRRVRPLVEFNKRKSAPDGRCAHCRECANQYCRTHYRRNKQYYKSKAQATKEATSLWVRQLKETTPCADCLVQYPACVMDFDHRPGTQKIAPVSTLVTRGGARQVRAEIAKCDIVCANCHRLRTAGRQAVIVK